MAVLLLLAVLLINVAAIFRGRRDPLTRQTVLNLVRSPGWTQKRVADLFGLSRATVSRWVSRARNNGDVHVYQRARGGPRGNWTHWHTLTIQFLVSNLATIYVIEAQFMIWRITGDWFSKAKILRRMHAMNLSRKIITKRFVESDPLVELFFWNWLDNHAFHIDQLMWLDESYLCALSANRKYGWALKFITVRVSVPF